jgi:hypothetical protein
MSALYRFIYYKLWHGLSFSQMPVMFSKATDKGMLQQSLLPSKPSLKDDAATTDKKSRINSFALQSDYVIGSSASSSSSYRNSTVAAPVIGVQWTHHCGVSLAIKNIGYFSSSGSCVIVQSIDEASEAYASGVREGFVLNAVQGQSVSAADAALETVLTSKEGIMVEFADTAHLSMNTSSGSPLSDIVDIMRVPMTFTAGSQLGLEFEERRSLFSSLSMYIVTEVTPGGVAADAGVCPGWMVSAINGNRDFSSGDFEHEISFKSVHSPSPTHSVPNVLSQNIEVEFIASTEGKVFFSFQQHLLNQKLRQSGLLLLTFPSGIPTFRGINLFPSITLNNFGLASAYCFASLALMGMHCGWFGFWLAWKITYVGLATISYPFRYVMCLGPVRSGWEVFYPSDKRSPALGATLGWEGLSIPVPVEVYLVALFGHIYMLMMSCILPFFASSTSKELWTLMVLNILLMVIAFTPLGFNRMALMCHAVAVVAFNISMLLEILSEPDNFDFGTKAATRTIGQFSCVLIILLYLCNGSKRIVSEKVCDAFMTLGFIAYIVLFSINVLPFA